MRSPLAAPFLAAPRVAIPLLIALALTGCGSSAAPAEDTKPTIVAAFYPLAYAARQVGGSDVNVIDLTPPGAEPHDLELTPQQVAQIADADLVLYIPGFQPAVDEAIAQQAGDRAVNVAESVTLLPDGDPHVWLDPLNMASIGDQIAARLSDAQPDLSDAAAKQAAIFAASMRDLDDAWKAGTADCRSRDLVVSHEAFAYLAQHYGFTQVAIAGLSPDAEPSPERLAEVARFVQDNDVRTIYYETLVDPKVAQTIAAETGATAAVLDPLEGLTEASNGDYATLMRQNLATVQSGQGCTS